ncbi:MAG TPA: alpha/beta fold hydrolase [Thermoanaerobaculia bacterium]|jgi:lysophospholipase
MSHFRLASLSLIAFLIWTSASAALTPLPAGVENRYHLITEDTYLRDYDAKVLPEVRKLERAGEFPGVDGVPIRYRTYLLERSKERGAVVISSGRTESLLIYPEVIYDLTRQGYSVFIHDHRGQGLSGRLLRESQKGHVVHFDDYVTDLETFMKQVVQPHGQKNLFLLAHSMGGGIASLYLERPGHDFKAAVLVTPMLEPLLGYKALTGTLCEASHTYLAKVVLGQRNYATEQKPYKRLAFGDPANDLTHSNVRWEKTRDIYAANMTAAVGGATHGWVREACSAAKSARANAGKVEVPLLLLQATEDTAVKNDAQNSFCVGVNAGGHANCFGYAIQKAYHAVLFEADTFRIPAMTAILDFLRRNTN